MAISNRVHTSPATIRHLAEGLDTPLVKIQELKVLSAAPDQTGEAHLIVAAAPHSGALVNARPCSSLGTRLDNSSLRIVVALRLGAPVCIANLMSVFVEWQLTAVGDADLVAASPPAKCLDTVWPTTSSNER